MEQTGKKNISSQYVESLSSLPEEYTEASYYYSVEAGKAFIPPPLRDEIVAVKATDAAGSFAENDIVILQMIKNGKTLSQQAQGTLLGIIKDYDKSTRYHTLHVLKTKEQSIFLNIKKELESKAKSNDGETSTSTIKAEELLYHAMKKGASDVHIESNGKRAKVKYRIHGFLYRYGDTISHEEAESLGHAFFAKFPSDSGKGSVFKSTNLLDSGFSRRIKDVHMKARAVNIGQNSGGRFKMVLRLIDKTKSHKAERFEDKGFSRQVAQSLRAMEMAPNGMVLIIGETGSGKSTSLHNAVMNEMQRTTGTRAIYSLEQPIEQEIPDITQIETSGEASESTEDRSMDFSFANVNRNLLRADPNSIVYGEIRDQLTAKAAIEGATTGHLVYGTLHVKDPLSVFERLEGLGVPMDITTRPDIIRVIMFQHLVPTICPHCAIKYDGENIPSSFTEVDSLKYHRRPDGTEVDFEEVESIRDNKMKPGESILRALQREKLLTSAEIVSIRRRVQIMNDEKENFALKRRLDWLVKTSMMKKEDISIQFKGRGCKKCFYGTNGVSPSASVLVPDAKLLEFIKNRDFSRAESYWRSNLKGFTAIEDAYEKILKGHYDPRIAERMLDPIRG